MNENVIMLFITFSYIIITKKLDFCSTTTVFGETRQKVHDKQLYKA